jgi:hypothetical protein
VVIELKNAVDENATIYKPKNQNLKKIKPKLKNFYVLVLKGY